ncbi:MAG: hypothetical protein AMXMBFR58_11690 [Phycisphaerae bacterium]
MKKNPTSNQECPADGWNAIALAVDSIRAPKESGSARIEWNPKPITELGPSVPPTWVWEGYLAAGHSTLFTGLWKSGKTTLISHVIQGITGGNKLVGVAQTSPVLVISEEAPRHWIRRREDLGLGETVHVINRPFKVRSTPDEWRRFIAHVAGLVARWRYCLVIIDTISSVWPVVNENDASEVMAALLPLHAITEAGAALLVIHHPRKGDAGEGQASRGSGALTGWVDVILEFRRYASEDSKDRRRVLRSFSRFEETPQEVVLEFGDEGYVFLGERPAVAEEDKLGVISQILSASDMPMRPEGVREQWPEPKPGKRAVEVLLKKGAEQKRWERAGEGTKAHPFVYHRPKCDSRTLSCSDAQIESEPPAPLADGWEVV